MRATLKWRGIALAKDVDSGDITLFVQLHLETERLSAGNDGERVFRPALLRIERLDSILGRRGEQQQERQPHGHALRAPNMFRRCSWAIFSLRTLRQALNAESASVRISSTSARDQMASTS